MERPPDTRADLRRALAANAATKPLNVLAPAVVAVAGSLLGTPWLIAVAFACWLAMSAITFFDEGEAERVGRERRGSVRAASRSDPAGLRPAIAGRLAAAVAARDAIRAAVRASSSPLEDVAEEVDVLVAGLDRHALRADRIGRYLDAHPARELSLRIASERSPSVVAALEAQQQAIVRLERRHEGVLADMDRAVASLETVHAELLAAEGVGDDVGRAVISEVVELRDRVQLVAAELEDVFEDTRAHLGAET